MNVPNHARRPLRAFSLIEMMIALSITGTLMAATLSALHASFQAYKYTTDAASTNIVTRMIMQRLMTMVRTGDQFGPYPADVLDTTQNPVVSNFIEFVSFYDPNTTTQVVSRIEQRVALASEQGPNTLYLVTKTYVNGTLTTDQETPLLQGVQNAQFTLDYDIGPRLKRATIDLTVSPVSTSNTDIYAKVSAPTIRLVSSVMSRRLEIVSP